MERDVRRPKEIDGESEGRGRMKETRKMERKKCDERE